MIYSESHRFYFFELPRTGTTSTRKALLDAGICSNDEDLTRHVSISAYRRKKRLNPDWKVVCGVRNPLDRILSLYLKLRSDKDGYYSGMPSVGIKNIFRRRLFKVYQDVQSGNMSFEEFLRMYVRHPYTDWMYHDVRYCDIVIRFESLESDFNHIKSTFGLPDDLTLPVENKIEGKAKDVWSYYPSSVREFVVSRFGPYMAKFEYEFPEEWPKYKPTVWTSIHFRVYDSVYRLFNRYLI
jgi:hypothetical protein